MNEVKTTEQEPLNWFAKEIRQKREAKDLTMKEAAKQLGIGHISLFRYEHGQNDPPLFLGLKICSFYGINPKNIPQQTSASTRSKNRQRQFTSSAS